MHENELMLNKQYELKFVDTDLEDDQLKRIIGQKNQKKMNHEKK